MKFKSEVQLEALNNATVDTDKFLVSDSSTVKYRTGAQLLSDLGIAGIYVPYTGATGNVDLGTHTLSSYNLIVNHTSGSGVAASITKGGNGEALTINKTSGSGNAMSVTGGLTSLVDLTLSSIANATTDTDRFIVSDSGAIKYRTGAQVLSDIGGQPALTNPITGTGTTNYLSKFTGTTSLGDSLIYDDGSNIALGTTTPLTGGGAAKWITLNGSSYGGGIISSVASVAKGYLYYDNTSETFAVQAASGVGATIWTNDTEKMRITSSGNVGIGTSSPSYKLDVVGSISNNSSQNIIYSSYDNVAALFQRVGTYGAVINLGRKGVSNSVTLDYPADGQFAITTNGSERMRIDSSGNVGIGTSSPARPLTVASSNIGIRMDNSSNSNAGLEYYVSTGTFHNWLLGAQYNIANAFEITPSTTVGGTTYSTPAFVVNANGNVLIGTTSDLGYKLNVAGTLRTTDYALLGYNTSVGNSSFAWGYPGSYYGQMQNVSSTVYGLGFGATPTTIGTTVLSYNTSGNVGIGTTTPDSKLDVTGGDITVNTNGTGFMNFKYGSVGSESAIGTIKTDGINISYNASSALTFGTAGTTERMRITSGGNVGIGDSSPGVKLSVADSANSTVASFIGANGGVYSTFNIMTLGANGNGFWRASTIGGNIKMVSNQPAINADGFSASAIAFGSDASQGRIGFFTTSSNTGDTVLTESMRINTNGNVGIGTTSPTVKLEVSSSGVVSWFRSTSNVVPVSVFNDTTSVSTIGFKGSTTSTEFVVRVGADGNDFVAYTNNAEKMRITSSGNVGIGTSSPGTQLEILGTDNSGTRNNPYNVLTVTADNPNAPYGGFGGAMLFKNRAYTSGIVNSTRVRSQINNNSVDSFGGSLHFDVTPTAGGSLTEAMMIKYNGNVGIGTTSPGDKLTVLGSDTTTFQGGGIYNSYTYGNSDKAESRFNLGKLEGSAYQPMGSIGAFPQTNTDSSNGILSFYTRTSQSVTEKMRITNTGNVGIGTSVPANKLVATSDASPTSENTYAIAAAAASDPAYKTVIGYDLTNDVGLIAAVRTSVAWKNISIPNGNLGIGTISPSAKLHISGSGNTETIIDSTAAGSSILTMLSSSGGSNLIGYGPSGPLRFGTVSGPNGTGLSEKMRIDANGNVGIGTSSPYTKLDVSGAIRSSAPDNPTVYYAELYANYDSANLGGVRTSQGNLIRYASDNSATYVGVGDTMTIKSGNVGIGTTTPTQKLDVVGVGKFSSSVQVGDDSATASATNVGATRYRSDSNNSYMDMVMQTGASTYAWVNVVQNNW